MIYNNPALWLRKQIDPVFANNTWEQIVKSCQTNKVPETWCVGDQKVMVIGDVDYPIDIIGKNHDDYADGSGKAPLTFQMHDCYATKYVMDDATVSEYIWEYSAIRTIYLPAIAALMPSEVQDGIKEVEKKTAVGTIGNNVINTIAESLFLLSEIEVFGTVGQSNSGEGKQYSYYSAGGSKIKNLGGSAIIWGERSPCAYSKTANCVVGTNGQQLSGDIGYQRGVAFAFCF